jgi:hypothetical protein
VRMPLRAGSLCCCQKPSHDYWCRSIVEGTNADPRGQESVIFFQQERLVNTVKKTLIRVEFLPVGKIKLLVQERRGWTCVLSGIRVYHCHSLLSMIPSPTIREEASPLSIVVEDCSCRTIRVPRTPASKQSVRDQ